VFGLFTPNCPLGTAEKVWVERRMRWLADRLGHERLRDARAVVPTADFFPDPYHPDEPSARRCLDRVCRYMRVDPASLALTVVADEAMPGAAGLYERGARSRAPVKRSRSNVYVAASQLTNPISLIATLAHEVGHEILLGGGVLTAQVEDHEQVTDLLTVFLGMGVFNANSTLHESAWNYGATYSGWSIHTQGYLSANSFGYALGVFAYLRGESNPDWAYYLRADAKGSLRAGLRYLRKTNDSLFRPDSDPAPRQPPTAGEVAAGLAHRSPTFRLAALHDLKWAGIDDPGLVPPVTRCLDDPDAGVRAEAARALAGFGGAAAPAVPRLIEIVQAESEAWACAIPTLAALRAEPRLVVAEIARLLVRQPRYAALLVSALRAYDDCSPAIPALLTALGREVANGGAIREVLTAVRALVPDPESQIRAHFTSDPELRRQILWELGQPVD
jgi:hypothetical protein